MSVIFLCHFFRMVQHQLPVVAVKLGSLLTGVQLRPPECPLQGRRGFADQGMETVVLYAQESQSQGRGSHQGTRYCRLFAALPPVISTYPKRFRAALAPTGEGGVTKELWAPTQGTQTGN